MKFKKIIFLLLVIYTISPNQFWYMYMTSIANDIELNEDHTYFLSQNDKDVIDELDDYLIFCEPTSLDGY